MLCLWKPEALVGMSSCLLPPRLLDKVFPLSSPIWLSACLPSARGSQSAREFEYKFQDFEASTLPTEPSPQAF